MDILDFLLQTRAGTFYVGAFLAVGFVLSCLALCFYVLYRIRLLLYFAAFSVLAHTILLFINYDPRVLIDVDGDPLLARLLHFAAALTSCALYLMTVETCPGGFKKSILHRLLFIAICISLTLRTLVIIFLTPELVRLVAVTCGSIFLLVGLSAMTFKTQSRFETVSKYSLMVVALAAIYPIARSGLFQRSLLDDVVVPVLLTIVSAFSIIWFVALVEISREKYSVEYQKRIQAFIELRDLMNTPIQVLTLGLDLLADHSYNQTVHQMQAAVGRLIHISRLLSRHEAEVKWDRTYFSLEPKNVSKK